MSHETGKGTGNTGKVHTHQSKYMTLKRCTEMLVLDIQVMKAGARKTYITTARKLSAELTTRGEIIMDYKNIASNGRLEARKNFHNHERRSNLIRRHH